MSRPTPDRPDEDEDLLARLVSESGDPKVEPRPEHVEGLRTLLLARLGPPRKVRPSRARWLVVSGLAAACLLAVLAWPRRDVEDPVRTPHTSRPAPQVTVRPADVSPGNPAWLETRRGLVGANDPTFHWPLQETAVLLVSSPVPADLLD